jgi:DNA-binding FrmR family transcriptional regulator
MTVQDTRGSQVLNRLKTVAGHVRGVRRMVEADAYCIDMITQTQAVQRALHKVNSLLLAEHLQGNVTDVLRDGEQPEREHIVTDLLAVFRQAGGQPMSLPAPASAAERQPQRLAWLDSTEERVRELQQMHQDDGYSVVLMTGIQDVQRMLDAFRERVLADHLNGCVTTAIRSDEPAERERVVRELLHVFDASSRM